MQPERTGNVQSSSLLPGRLTLEAGRMRASVAPGSGGRISGFWEVGPEGSRRDILVPLPEGPFDATRWPKAGCYPLIPYSNRIRGAEFPFRGRMIRLPEHPDSRPHALHGFSQMRPWQGEASGPASVDMTYRHEPDFWPWAFEASQQIRLSEAGLSITLTLRNTGQEPMPAGLGLHPFLAAAPDDAVICQARHDWTFDDSGCAIARQDLPPGEEWSTHVLRQAPFSRYLSGWTGPVEFRRADGLPITVTGNGRFDHLILHAPAGAAYLCIEPVSHVADGFNLADRGVEGTGVIVLEPGAQASGAMMITTGVKPRGN